VRFHRPILFVIAFVTAPGLATVVNVINADPAGVGLNDPTPRAPVTGNPGSTVGQQRLNVFVAAAQSWAATLDSTVPIDLIASFDALDCDATGAVLGQASPTVFFRDDGGVLPLLNTWYPAGLAEALAGEDLTGEDGDIAAVFSTSLDDDPNCIPAVDWWYGIGGAAPANSVDFYRTVLHEIGHGLGFLTVVNKATGEKLQGFDDVYMSFLQDGSLDKLWPALTNTQRAASAKDDGDLLWTGSHVVGASGFLAAGRKPDGRVQIYAPPILEPGSSVSHFDTDLTPNELMEPILNNDAQDVLAVAALQDLGWSLAGATGPCVADGDTACLLDGRFVVEVEWSTLSSSGNAQIMSFAGQRASSDQSVFWYFFDNANFEMGVKMVEACVDPFNAFWVFVSGLTNQGFTVTITDTDTGRIRTYSNPLGVYPQTVGATGTGDGFPCN
jgi:hypothetical protein